MQLLTSHGLNREDKRKFFRNGFLPDLVMSLLFVLAPASLLWAKGQAILGLSWWLLLVLAPIGLVVGLLMFVVASGVLQSLMACFRSGNWIMIVSRAGLHLNLRSYRHWHFGGEDPTVVRLDFCEIKSAGRVTQVTQSVHGDTGRTEFKRFLEITLVDGISPELGAAIRQETNREAPERKFLGVTSSTKFNHVPVSTPRPGVLHVEWKRGMLRALSDRVQLVDPRKVDDENKQACRSFEENLQALLGRAERMAAIQLVRSEHELSLTGAKLWLSERERKSA